MGGGGGGGGVGTPCPPLWIPSCEIFSLSGAILQLAEQEKYELQMRLDAKLSMEEWYNEEITHLRNQQAEGHDNLRQTLESEKHMEVSKLTRQVHCFYYIGGISV